MKLCDHEKGSTIYINGEAYIFNGIQGVHAKCTKIEGDVPMLIIANIEVEDDSTNEKHLA